MVSPLHALENRDCGDEPIALRGWTRQIDGEDGPQMKKLLLLAAMIPAPALAHASIQFSTYQGDSVVNIGTGGTVITGHGIDYWTSGTPPRRYQVIGMISDRRYELWDGGHAIGSPTVAGKVKAAGGNAVIVENQDEAGRTGGGGFFKWFAMGGSKTITRMLVIRYMPSEAALKMVP
jgi:hypothetical protein